MPADSFRDERTCVVGEWRVEPSLGRICRGDRSVSLEPKTMAVLQYLAARPGDVVSGDELIDSIWDGRPMGDTPVYRCIAQLRKALGDNPRDPDYIATVPKRGYRLVAAVRGTEEGLVPAEVASSAPTKPRRSQWSIALAFAVLVVAGGFAVWQAVPEPATSESARRPALAILPFRLDDTSPTGPPSGPSLARAVTERLAGEPGVRIIDHDSAAVVGESRIAPQRAAQLLRATHLLHGTLIPRESGVIASLRMTDASGREIWSGRAEASDPEDPRLVDEVVRLIADRFGIDLRPALSPGCRGTTSIRACRDFLLAHEHLYARGENYQSEAIALLQRAIAEQPAFAAAHADLAVLYLLPNTDRSWEESIALASAAIDRALELDPGLAEAHSARGLLLMRDPDWGCPPTCFRRDLQPAADALLLAVQLDPGHSRAYHWLAIVRYAQGDLIAAEANLERALAFDPMNPVLHFNSALFAALRGDPTGAREILDEFRSNHPDPPSFLTTGFAIFSSLYGEYGESLSWTREYLGPSASTRYDYFLAMAYLNLGMLDSVDRLLSTSDDQPLIDSSTVSVRKRLHQARNDVAGLTELAFQLEAASSDRWGAPADRPRWIRLTSALILSLLGEHASAIDRFETVYRVPFEQFDHQSVTDELDGMLYFAHSLASNDRHDEAVSIARSALGIFRALDAQGYAELPDLIYLKAVAHAVLGEQALAIATLRQAISRGWLRHWKIENDPRWASLRSAADFVELVNEVEEEVAAMRASIDVSLHPGVAKPPS